MKTTGLRVVHTWAGIPFYDDKYPDEIAQKRLVNAVQGSLPELIDIVGDSEYVYETIQPSDDCYSSDAVEAIQRSFYQGTDRQVVGWRKGYVMDYRTLALREWNPNTIPPFFTIRFPKGVFIEPYRHASYAGYKSHEYVGDNLRFKELTGRGFIVGTHGHNISTVFDHPFSGQEVPREVLADFGIGSAQPLTVLFTKTPFDVLPYPVKRKLRYWAGEKRWPLRWLFSLVYNLLRA